MDESKKVNCEKNTENDEEEQRDDEDESKSVRQFDGNLLIVVDGALGKDGAGIG